MVGVGQGLSGDVPGGLPLHVLFIDQQAHQFGDCNGRMGIVELDRKLLVKARQRLTLGPHDAQHVLQGARHKEVLLLQSQFFALNLLIVRIEHLRDVLGNDLAVDRTVKIPAVELINVKGLGGFGAPQPQRVGGVRAVSQDGRVIGHATHGPRRDPLDALTAIGAQMALGVATQLDLHRPLRADQLPGVALP